MGHTTGAAVKIYQITYIIGFFLGGILHLIVNTFFPVSGLGIDEPFEEAALVEGITPLSLDGTGGEDLKGVQSVGEKFMGKV
jgi:hypothetical protein